MADIRKRIRLTNHQKMEICTQHDNAIGFMSQGELRRWAQQQFNLPALPSQALISHILKNKRTILERGKIKSAGKSSKTTELVQLEKILLQHIQLMASKNKLLSGPEIRDHAEIIAAQLDLKKKFKFSNGWLQNFRQRNQLKKFATQSECIAANTHPFELEAESTDEPDDTESIEHDTDNFDTSSPLNYENDELEYDDSEKQDTERDDQEKHKNNELIDGLEKVLHNMSPDTDEEVIFAMTASKMLYKLKSNALKKKIQILEDA